MKFLLAFLLSFSLGVKAVPHDLSADIAAAIRMGNARELSKYFGANIDLTVSGKEEMYSKAQAEQVLRGFFAKNPPKSFVLKHKANNPTAAQYVIGSYISTSGNKFRIYFLIKKIGNQSFIQQLSIETEV
jgi:hypothetical protein